jgi:hypothetical protein
MKRLKGPSDEETFKMFDAYTPADVLKISKKENIIE